MKALVEDGVLKNPPAVLMLDDRVGEYVVIDGANRTQALLSPGLSYAPMQFLHPVGDEITLDTWAQVIEGCSPDHLARKVERKAGLNSLIKACARVGKKNRTRRRDRRRGPGNPLP
ncbi:MAG: hypothetical protein V3T55_02195 [Anaerolineales bacterium]